MLVVLAIKLVRILIYEYYKHGTLNSVKKKYDFWYHSSFICCSPRHQMLCRFYRWNQIKFEAPDKLPVKGNRGCTLWQVKRTPALIIYMFITASHAFYIKWKEPVCVTDTLPVKVRCGWCLYHSVFEQH